ELPGHERRHVGERTASVRFMEPLLQVVKLSLREVAAEHREEVEATVMDDGEVGLRFVPGLSRANLQPADRQVAITAALDLLEKDVDLERITPWSRLALGEDQTDRVVRQHTVKVDDCGLDQLFPDAAAGPELWQVAWSKLERLYQPLGAVTAEVLRQVD